MLSSVAQIVTAAHRDL